MSQIDKIIKQENVKNIALQFADISGVVHSLWVPSKYFLGAVESGIHTDGSSVGMVDVSKSDLKLVPDLDSFTILPPGIFPERVAFVICDIYKPESNQLFELSPRFVLKNALIKVRESLGSSVTPYTSSEMEYWLFKKGEDGQISLLDEGAYLATPPLDKGIDFRLQLVDNLGSMGISIEKHHHEVPPGKYELNIAYKPALKMADTVYLVKTLLKLMAVKHGLIASCMPKPFHGQYGAGLHTHVSVIDDEKSANLFDDPKGEHGLSKTASHFLAGILAHANALAGITNPSVNSYKRLVPGWEAPVYISWARYNRSTLIRVPPGRGLATRLEYRPSDGSCNFYIAYAAILYAGLDGIQRKLEPPSPVEEDIYHMSENERTQRGIGVLPGSLGDALAELSKDKVLREAFGQAFFEKYLEIKLKEWKDFSTTVHEWERRKYIDV
ncbi:MAG: glutamine synthetase family protein [Promethearchaeota archaeon]